MLWRVIFLVAVANELVSGKPELHSRPEYVHAIPLYNVRHQASDRRAGNIRRHIVPSAFMQSHSTISRSQLSELATHHQTMRMRSHRTGLDLSDGSNVIPLTNLRDSQYVGPIGVGSKRVDGKMVPESYVNVVFDTGSTNLWVSSDLCRDLACSGRSQYHPKLSITHSPAPSQFGPLDITFGTGELTGPQAVDSLSVGSYTVQNQTFAMIEHEIGSIFSQIPFEGILGLAFPSMAADGHVPFFDNVIDQNVLGGRNEFSFFFTKLPEQTSAIFFGGVDRNLYHGDLRMFPVIQEHYWTIAVDDFLIGDESFAEIPASPFDDVYSSDYSSLSASSDETSFSEVSSTKKHKTKRVNKLIVDTGTTYFTAPPGLAQRILARLPSADCSKTTDYPNLTYRLTTADGEKYDLVVPPSVYMVGDTEGSYCEPAFMEIPVPYEYGPAFLLGEVFMREWYTTFVRGSTPGEKSYIGFAKARHDDVTMKRVTELRNTARAMDGLSNAAPAAAFA